MEPTSSGIKTWQWVVTVIVIIAIIIICVMVFGGKGSQAPATEETPVATVTDQNTAINRIVMSDQYPGNVVYLSSVQVATSSYVVIQSDSNGVPGAIIGSARFNAGINPGKIDLTKPMVDGGTYYAVIYTDDNSGKFNTTNDTPVKNAAGQIIMQVFKASTSVGAGQKG